MILLNFAHPLTPGQLQQIETLTGQKVERVIETGSQINPQQPLAPQVVALADQNGLTAEDWQTLPILINPPSLNHITVALLAELHGRMGYFPSIVRLRPVQGTVPPRFEVAEVLDLQAIRDRARERRTRVN